MSENAYSFSIDDIHELNRASMDYVHGLSDSELEARVGDLAFENLGDPDSLLAAQEVLDEYGIVVFKNALDQDTCIKVEAAINALFYRYWQLDKAVVEDATALFQIGSEKLKGFYQLANYNKTVITVRQGQDQGMVDIFNCDLAIPDVLEPLKQLFASSYVLDVINSEALKPQNLNAYINESITVTRGFHVDSYSEHLKAFVYLSDVKSLQDGPYTYVKGSHKESAFRRANRELCTNLSPTTEAPIIDPTAITPVLAPRGSLVISDQAGVHRGWPQLEGRRRMASVMKYA